MYIKIVTFLLSFSLLPIVCLSQNSNVDSLKLILKSSKCDTIKISLLNKISKQYCIDGNYETALVIANEILLFPGVNKNLKEKAKTYKSIGNIYYGLEKNDDAIYYYKKSIQLYDSINNDNEKAYVLDNLGLVYEAIDNYKEALKVFLESIKIHDKLADKKGLAISYNNIGIIFYNQGYFDKSLEYHNKSLKIKKSLNDLRGISESYNNIGVIYCDQKKINLAIKTHKISLDVSNKINFKNGIALSYNNLGLCYRLKNSLDSALYFNLKSLKINEELNNKRRIALAAFNVGSDYLELNDLEQATFYATKSLNVSKEIKNLYLEQSNFSLFTKIYKKQKKYTLALKYSELDAQITDSIFNLESQKDMAELNTKYETEKKDKELIKLEKEKKEKQLEINSHKSQKHLLLIILFALVIIVTILTLFSYLIKKTSNQLEVTNKILIKKNQEIELKKEEINRLAVQNARFQSQMNPHFIFNALNGMQAAIMLKDFDKSLMQLQTFSKLMRLTLNLSEQDYITLDVEKKYMHQYISFEHQRFVNKFQFYFNINSNIDSTQIVIPPMLIQPIVENSIKHAGLNKINDGIITINIELVDVLNIGNMLQVEVCDNGCGFNYSTINLKMNSKGLYITKQRIKNALQEHNILLNDNCFIIESSLNSSVRGTITKFYLPYKTISQSKI